MFTLMGRFSPREGERLTAEAAAGLVGKPLAVAGPKGRCSGMVVEANLDDDGTILVRVEVDGEPTDL